MPTDHIKKYLDWRGWFRGLYLNCVKSATGVILATVGTNTAEHLSPETLKGAGLNWKQAVITFGAVLVLEAVRYINQKPLPDEVLDSVGSG